MAYLDKDKIVYGGNVMAFVNNEPVAFSKTANLSVSMDTREISSKDSGKFKELAAGRLGWNVATDGLLSYSISGSTNSIDTLYSTMIAREAVTIAFASKTGTSNEWTIDASKKNFTGKAFITSLEQSAGDGEDGTYSVTFEGASDLNMV